MQYGMFKKLIFKNTKFRWNVTFKQPVLIINKNIKQIRHTTVFFIKHKNAG
jgi:hypothetical protein